MPSMHIITLERLSSAHVAVTRELHALGLYDARMQQIDCYLVPVGVAYGLQYYGGTGDIRIPCVSLSKLCDCWRGTYTSLRDVLRHEYGHALADTHRGLIRSARFTDAFGGPHGWDTEFEYDPLFHVSRYAAAATAEDFAELFMLYVRHGGALPKRFATEPIRGKWGYLAALRTAIASGRARW